MIKLSSQISTVHIKQRTSVWVGVVLAMISNGNHKVVLTKENKYALLLISSIAVTAKNLSIFYAIKYTSALNAAVVMANMPLAGMLLSSMLLKTSMSRNNFIGIVISILGVYLVITRGDFSLISFNVGGLLMLLALICGCLYTILSKLWVPKVPIGQ
ncbi:DMT family transporter [Vibrio vulnificus]|nr:DMT family transporter [Vibrio vulnificus]EKG2458834.1 DMT family transporter [Vibrio vulnificus]